jgi:galactokinase
MTADRSAILDAFRRRFGRGASVVAEAPGRVNLIGEHTDYNEGHVLPLAIDRTVAVAALVGEEGVRAVSLDYGEEDAFAPAELRPGGSRGWRAYVRGVVWALAEAGVRPAGVDRAFGGDVPQGAGLSSSAALEVALAAAIAAVAGTTIEGGALAALARRAENEFVGVQCGPMDQLAAVFGREGHALLIDCRSLVVEPVPLEGVEIVVVESGVQRTLADSPYNRRRQEGAEAAAALGARSLRDVSATALEARRRELPEALYRRARHVLSEEVRVAAAADALRRGQQEIVGRLLYGSHASMRDDFEASCPEIDRLVEAARATEGVLGARITGGGFGGCTVNLLRPGAAAAFERSVVEPFRAATGLPARSHLVRASDGLRVSNV